MIRLCCCSRAGGGTGACLIGKQSSLDTIHKNSAKSACHNLTETKSLLEDPSDHRRDHAEIDHDQKNSDQKITACMMGTITSRTFTVAFLRRTITAARTTRAIVLYKGGI